MAIRIEVIAKGIDTRAEVRKKKLQNLGLGEKIKDIFIADVYTIEKKFSQKQLKLISSMLSNPVTQSTFIYQENIKDRTFLRKFDHAIEIGFLKGVTDNVANTTREVIEDLLKVKFKQAEGVYTSQITFIQGDLSKEDVLKITESLSNSLIQKIQVKSFRDFKKDCLEVNLNTRDEELKQIGKSGILDPQGFRRGPLALDLSSMKEIQKYFKKLKRNPRDIELESIAQTWSEHCKHTIFAGQIDEIKKGLFKTYIKAATDKIMEKSAKGKKDDFCVSVFTDNSGAISFDDQYLITHKVETHNSPSALDPYGGAITGIVGVNRDAIGFGLGAKPVINTYGYCFASPLGKRILYKDPQLKQAMLSPRRILDGVIDGVNVGGNCSGIPTPQGFVYFDKSYQGKPMVFVGTVGLIPKLIGKRKSYIKKAKPGDYIVVVGGRVGKDGIHGATFSSEVMDSGSPFTAVQIGDPITQKKLSDAIVKEARDQDLYSSITDNGAGGLSCSIAEMAKESGGCHVKLDKVPLKYPDLEPWQIWISESQERMTLSVNKSKWKKFKSLMKRRGVEATIIGEFTKSGKCVVEYNGKVIMDIEMEFLHDGLPQRVMQTKKPQIDNQENLPKEQKNLTDILHKMLERPNISSIEFISSQYDHEVQSGSVLKPLLGRGRINSDATVIRPVLDSKKGVVLSQGLYPSYSDIDTYKMAAASIDTAIRNIVCVGADIEKIALLDNFCWCSSNEPERLYQLKMAAKACYDLATSFNTPFISGKDSMFNDFKGFDENGNPIKISILPTLLISSIGVMDNVLNTVSLDLKYPGDLIYVLGETYEEMGGSEYLQMLNEEKSKKYFSQNVPSVNVLKNRRLYKTIFRSIEKGLIASSVSVSRGGLLVAFSRMAMAGRLGVEVSLKRMKSVVKRDDFALFSESQGRIIVTTSPKNKKNFEKEMKGLSYAFVGEVREDNDFFIKGLDGKVVIKTDVERLLRSYRETFKGY